MKGDDTVLGLSEHRQATGAFHLTGPWIGTLFVVLLSAGSANALTTCDEDSLCPGPGPCTIGTDVQLTDGCDLDFGPKTVTISPTGALRARPTGVSIQAGNLVVQGLLQAPGIVPNLPGDPVTLKITVDNSFEVQPGGRVDVEAKGGTQMGSAHITAGGPVELVGCDLSADGGAAGAGGDIVITAGTGLNIQDCSLHADGAGGSDPGGTITLTASTQAIINGPLSVKGGVPLDGTRDVTDTAAIVIEASGLLQVTNSIQAQGTRENGGGSIKLTSTGAQVQISGTGADELNVDSAGTLNSSPSVPQGGFITVDAAKGILLSGQTQVHAKGTGGGNGGFVSLLARGGNAQVDAELSTAATGSYGWGGGIAVHASGDITVGAKLDAHGASDGVGGAVQLFAGGSATVSGDIDVTAARAFFSQGGYIQVAAGSRGNITIGGLLDARAQDNRDGVIVIGPACDVRLSGSVRTDGGGFGGTNIVKYRRGFDASGGTIKADSGTFVTPDLPSGNVIECGCQDVNPADGLCDDVASCTSYPQVETGTPISVRPLPLGSCGCGDGTINPPGETCDENTCVGGSQAGNPCSSDAGCPGGQCRRGDGDLTCVGGAHSGEQCDADEDCESGVCGGGPNAGEPCSTSVDCLGYGCNSGTCHDGSPCSGFVLPCSDGPCSVATCQPVNGATCGPSCVSPPRCGDGVLSPGEECDDGDTSNGDGCSSGCMTERPLWQCNDICDESSTLWFALPCTAEPSFCTPICGDGHVISPEQCDDGNSDSFDGCSDSCQREAGYNCSPGEPSICTPLPAVCGNHVLEPPEECDDRHNSDNGECKTNCTLNVPGDGKTHTGVETCDNGGRCVGGPIAGEPCTVVGTTDAATEECGGGRCRSGDGALACVCTGCPDDGQDCTDDTDCTSGGRCEPVRNAQCDPNGQSPCGNGYRAPGEECDDGNDCSHGRSCNGNSRPCRSDCRVNHCGDGCVNCGSDGSCGSNDDVEQCDAGVNGFSDGGCEPDFSERCDAYCRLICGNGRIDPGEQCDEGPNNGDSYWCTTQCRFNVCGDGKPNRADPPPHVVAMPYAALAVPFNWIDISANSTAVPLQDDEVSGPIDIGFDVRFFGQTFSQVYISSNGFIAFDPPGHSGCCSGLPLPSAGTPAGNMVAGFWTDLYPPGGEGYAYARLGDVFVIQADAPLFSAFFSELSESATFQYHLHQGSDRIEIHYRRAQPGFQLVTAGVQNSDRTEGSQHYSSAMGDLEETAVVYDIAKIAKEGCDDGSLCTVSHRCNGDNRRCKNDCTRNPDYKRPPSCRKRLATWYVQSPAPTARRMVCQDGAAWCDEDHDVNGECLFSMNLCALSQPLGADPSCEPQSIERVTLTGLDPSTCWGAEAAQTLADIVSSLDPSHPSPHGVCTNNSTPPRTCGAWGHNSSCDAHRTGDGVCSPQVSFSNQLALPTGVGNDAGCPGGIASAPRQIKVPAGRKLRVRSLTDGVTRRVQTVGDPVDAPVLDRDRLYLKCKKAGAAPPPTWTEGPCPPTPIATPTETDTPPPTATQTETATPTATDTATPTPSATVTETASATVTETASVTVTSTATQTATASRSATRTRTATATRRATRTPRP